MQNFEEHANYRAALLTDNILHPEASDALGDRMEIIGPAPEEHIIRLFERS